jgi:hypothetical protein
MMRTAGEEREKRESKKETQRERERERENKGENELNTDYNFLCSIFFLGCNFVDETPCCPYSAFHHKQRVNKVIVKLP